MNDSVLFYRHRKNQQGAVLIVGLIMLLLLTLIGVSGMSSVTMEEKMVSNMQNSNRSFQGAEAAISSCENFIINSNLQVLQVGAGVTVNVGDHAAAFMGPGNWWESGVFWANNGTEFDAADQGLASNPRCVIEFVGKGGGALEGQYLVESPGVRYVYRVTGVSPGYDTTTWSAVESLYARF